MKANLSSSPFVAPGPKPRFSIAASYSANASARVGSFLAGVDFDSSFLSAFFVVGRKLASPVTSAPGNAGEPSGNTPSPLAISSSFSLVYPPFSKAIMPPPAMLILSNNPPPAAAIPVRRCLSFNSSSNTIRSPLSTCGSSMSFTSCGIPSLSAFFSSSGLEINLPYL